MTPKDISRTCVGLSLLATLLLLPAKANSGLTPEEATALRKAGVGDAVIECIKQCEREADCRHDANAMGVREISDPDGTRAVIHSTGPLRNENLRASEKDKLERAWRILENLRIHGPTPVKTSP